MVSWVDPMGFAPLPGKSLFEDSGAGSSTGARDAIGNTQIHWDHTRNGKKEFTCFSLPEPLRSHFLRFLSTCKNRIIITFKWNSCSSPYESPSARNSSFSVVFEESGVCWPLSKAHPCWICPRATWTNESFILDIFIPVLRRSCASFHFLKTPDSAFLPIPGCHVDVSMKQKPAARSWTFKDNSPRSTGRVSDTPLAVPFPYQGLGWGKYLESGLILNTWFCRSLLALT